MTLLEQVADVAGDVAVIGAGLGVLGLLARKSLKGVRWAGSTWQEWAARFAALEGLVHHELTPNSGTSVKDSLARVETRLADVDGRQLLTAGLLAQHVEESRSYLDAVTAGLAEQGITLPPAAPPHIPAHRAGPHDPPREDTP